VSGTQEDGLELGANSSWIRGGILRSRASMVGLEESRVEFI